MKIDYKYSPIVGLSIMENIPISKWTGLANQNGDKQSNKKQDSLSISRQALSLSKQNGSKPSVLGRLMEQKQNIMERRQQYVTQAMEKGTSPEVIQMELDELDTQLEKIDNQLSKLQLEEQRKALGMNDEGREDEKTNEETRNPDAPCSNGEQTESLGTHQMKTLISASTGMNQSSSVTRAQLTLNREAKSWEHSDPARSAALKDKAESLNGKLLEIAGQVNKTIASKSSETNPKESMLHDTSESRADEASRLESALTPAVSAPEEEQEYIVSISDDF
ncbi:hypothetical protein OB236_16980 [Paenibacillus sp. WQ 127069]|uniref:Uncharacterized protein n=1 Tax=Paenibacillus baimaensis TaxID=2982185 RepID=A0ABT2UGN2_9BACL|nr:hypothetical protein [Paenibacillus sp. WQ 127069]MCU6793801.1 hypothetical protein [Paenibacillus sp. WQ 127069]